MKKEWFLDRYCGQQFVALIEDGKVAEFEVEKEEFGCIIGNVYKGRVMNVLTGMNAAFIDCGLERNCYLAIDEAYTDCNKYDGKTGEMKPSHCDITVPEGVKVLGLEYVEVGYVRDTSNEEKITYKPVLFDDGKIYWQIPEEE
jgi:Ribonuclease G/E